MSQRRERGTINIHEATKKRLHQVKGKMDAQDGKGRDHEDVINELIDFWEEHHRKENP